MIAAMMSEGGGGHEPPVSVFTPVWRWFVASFPEFSKTMGFDTADRHLGMYWFEAICFSLVGSIFLITLAFFATRKYNRVPRGLQNLLEFAVSALRGMVNGIAGPAGDKYLPYLGTLFLFIFTMNMIGIFPMGRAPTMTLSTTAALGITTFVMIQAYAIRDSGPVRYVKHFMGDVLWLAPLMIVVEVIGELAKPLSLSLRLFGNIFGEDNVIEQLMTLGGWIPVQLPMLALAIFTSFLQAFIFTTLATIYIASKVVHEHDDHGEEHGEPKVEHGHHGAAAAPHH